MEKNLSNEWESSGDIRLRNYKILSHTIQKRSLVSEARLSNPPLIQNSLLQKPVEKLSHQNELYLYDLDLFVLPSFPSLIFQILKSMPLRSSHFQTSIVPQNLHQLSNIQEHNESSILSYQKTLQ